MRFTKRHNLSQFAREFSKLADSYPGWVIIEPNGERMARYGVSGNGIRLWLTVPMDANEAEVEAFVGTHTPEPWDYPLHLLEDELRDAGIPVRGLGATGDTIHTYDEKGVPIPLPAGADAIIDSFNPPPTPDPDQLYSSLARRVAVAAHRDERARRDERVVESIAAAGTGPATRRDAGFLGQRVVGTILWPRCYFGEYHSQDAIGPTQVIADGDLGGFRVLVTRMGGIYTVPGDEFSDLTKDPTAATFDDLERKLDWQEEVATALNRLVCELALLGIVCEPITPVELSRGGLEGGHVIMRGASGEYSMRSLNAFMPLLTGKPAFEFLRPGAHPQLLVQAFEQTCTGKLVEVAQALASRGHARKPSARKGAAPLPTLVAGAYSLFARGMLAEALSSSWTVAEQLVSFWWHQYARSLSETRMNRLVGSPPEVSAFHPVAVRLEMLLEARAVTPEIYESLSKARAERNDLLHYGQVDRDAAEAGIRAMVLCVEHLCQRAVKVPYLPRSVNW